MWPDLQEGVLYTHHFIAQILPSLGSYTNVLAMRVYDCQQFNSLLSEACQTSTSVRMVFFSHQTIKMVLIRHLDNQIVIICDSHHKQYKIQTKNSMI